MAAKSLTGSCGLNKSQLFNCSFSHFVNKVLHMRNMVKVDNMFVFYISSGL